MENYARSVSVLASVRYIRVERIFSGAGKAGGIDHFGFRLKDPKDIDQAVKTLREICSDENTDLARLSVALRVVRSLL